MGVGGGAGEGGLSHLIRVRYGAVPLLVPEVAEGQIVVAGQENELTLLLLGLGHRCRRGGVRIPPNELENLQTRLVKALDMEQCLSRARVANEYPSPPDSKR